MLNAEGGGSRTGMERGGRRRRRRGGGGKYAIYGSLLDSSHGVWVTRITASSLPAAPQVDITPGRVPPPLPLLLLLLP